MRKLFLSTIGISAILTLSLGIAFAWTSTATNSGYTASGGSLSVAIVNDAYTGNVLYPTGTPIAVLTGQIQNNTPANPGIGVYITGGTVTGITQPLCASSGAVAVSDSGWLILPGGWTGGAWSASLTMPVGAPDACQGLAFSYNVNVAVATP